MIDEIYDESGTAVGAVTEISDADRLLEIADSLEIHKEVRIGEREYGSEVVPDDRVHNLRRIAEKLRWRPASEYQSSMGTVSVRCKQDGLIGISDRVYNNDEWRPLDG